MEFTKLEKVLVNGYIMQLISNNMGNNYLLDLWNSIPSFIKPFLQIAIIVCAAHMVYKAGRVFGEYIYHIVN
jgi:hypothetical protein